MTNRKRDIRLRFRVTPEEREQIEKRMEQLGTTNMAAFLRKMALDGYVVRLELPELREMVSLLRRSSNNLNQIAKRVNETSRFYAADMEDMLQKQEQLWQAANDILTRLAAIK
ncbi:MAG: plasmid mobilization relaxosome protein MobC [Oscillospiraceae bacterium]|nr:plasmid mobilization relaxosome protein MobC [Oscillospiraceae bacterium]